MKNKLRRFLALCMSVVVFSLSVVPAFALVNITVSDSPLKNCLKELSPGVYTLLDPVDFSGTSSSLKEKFLADWELCSGKNPTKESFFQFTLSNVVEGVISAMRFYVFDKGSLSLNVTAGNLLQGSCPAVTSYSFTYNVNLHSWSLISNQSGSTVRWDNTTVGWGTSDKLESYYWGSYNLYNLPNTCPKFLIPSDVKVFAPLEEMLPDLEPPPSSSSEPDPPPSLPDIEIPEGDPTYVPYDTSGWRAFYEYIRNTIATTVTTIFPYFGFLVSIYLVIWVVRRFTS